MTPFKDSLHLGYVPAKETVRLYLEKIITEKDRIITAVDDSIIKLLKSTKLTSIIIEGRNYIPVDIETSPMDNS